MAPRISGVSSDDPRLYEIVHGRPQLQPGVRAKSKGARRVSELSSVRAVSAPLGSDRIHYWTFTGVSRDEHDLPADLSYDLTFLTSDAVGWERPKTHGHAHVVPELYEVLEGRAAFVVQDLRPGPSATFVGLIEAEAGDCVVIPPAMQHLTVNRGNSMLVVADVIATVAQHNYAELDAARGAAYYQRVEGEVTRNPNYLRAAPVTRWSVSGWSDATADGPLYAGLVDRRDDFAWLARADGFAFRFPDLAERLAGLMAPGGL